MRRYPGNHTDSELLTVPRFLKTRPGAPQTHLAYITDSEADLLQKNKPGTPHKGAEGIPNYDAYDIDSGAYVGGGDWQESSSGVSSVSQPRDTSYSTRDIRSSPQKREEFRQKTNQVLIDPKSGVRTTGEHYIQTPAERIARTRKYLTGQKKYLNMPIWNPAGLSYDEQLKIAQKGEELRDWELANKGKYSKDWGDFLDPLLRDEFGKKRQDISDTGFSGTSKGWYFTGDTDAQGNPIYTGGDGGGGYGYGYGYGGGGGSGGYGYGYGEDEDPFPRGYQREKVGPGGLLEAVNKLLFRLSGLSKKRGGIVSLLELR